MRVMQSEFQTFKGGGGLQVRIRRGEFADLERGGRLPIPLELRKKIFSHVFDFRMVKKSRSLISTICMCYCLVLVYLRPYNGIVKNVGLFCKIHPSREYYIRSEGEGSKKGNQTI